MDVDPRGLTAGRWTMDVDPRGLTADGWTMDPRTIEKRETMKPTRNMENWDDILHDLQNLAEKYPAVADEIWRIVEKIAIAAGVD